MKAVMIMFDSLNRRFLNPYGCSNTITPNFSRLAEHTIRFENCYAGSLPCMPARRELHTGRCNFLHRSWGPLEPFDDSMPQILDQHNIHSHLASDHTHYWEDGGATYHTRYSTWENFRGQEGDPWKGVAGGIGDTDPNLVPFKGMRKDLYDQDIVNRSYLKDEEYHPQALTFKAGMEFINTNAHRDSWFLQLETFDPHEPFFSYQKYRDLYPSDYSGPRFDWPDYAPVIESPDEIAEARRSYFALLSMCDHYLGKVLDLFDRLDLWKDTMLIVNTDHGYLLGEHGFWAKNYMPQYNEIVHTPLFIWDPRYGKKDETRSGLVQTIDLPVTILDFFNIEPTPDMEGKSLAPLIAENTSVRDAGLFGVHGGYVCCTDGRYVYMKAPAAESNRPLYEYTLMPAHMNCLFFPAEIKTMEKAPPFSFTKDMPLMRFESMAPQAAWRFGDLLFDLDTDPEQLHPIKDNPALEKMMREKLIALMKENDAPREQFRRLGLDR
ncbi:sulfatase [Spirochaetia bacterium]|nr:sulfatase [Spirochaetia bacterium]